MLSSGFKFATPLVQSSRRNAPAFLRNNAAASSNLENGVKVVSVASNSDLATASVFVPAGSRYEDGSNLGASHFLRSLGITSTNNRTHLRIVRELEHSGLNVNVSNDREHIVYTVNGSSDAIATGVEIIGDFISEARVTDIEVKDAHAGVLADVVASQHSASAAVERFYGAGFRNRNLGHSTLATAIAAQTLSPDAVREFRDNHFGPKGITVVGCVPDTKAFELAAAQNFGGIVGGSAPANPAAYTGGSDMKQTGAARTHYVFGFKGTSDPAVNAVLASLLASPAGTSNLYGSSSVLGQAGARGYSFNDQFSDASVVGVGARLLGNTNEFGDKFSQALKGLKSLSEDDVAAAKAVAATHAAAVDNTRAGFVAGLAGKRSLGLAAGIAKVSTADVQKAVADSLAQPLTVAGLGDVYNLPRADELL